jgi:hypothetical protein
VPVAEKVILRHRYVFLAGETMKAARFILITGLFIAAVLVLLVFTKVRPEQGRHNGTAQVLTKRDVSVAHTSKENNGKAPATLNSRSGRSLSEHVAFANPASKIDISPSKNLPVAQDKPRLNLPVGQKAEALFASEGKPDLPVSQRHQSIAPAGATDETKSDSMESNPAGIDIGRVYLNNPEVHGQNGQLLPSPEKVLASKAKSILENYKDRNAEGVITSEEEEGDDYETKPGEQGLKDDTGLDSANTGEHTETVTTFTDVASTVEMLAEQSTSDNPADAKSRTAQLLAALADGNPVDVRLQAIYLLADVAPDEVGKFLNDKEDIIRCEAERIVGIIPQD